MSVFGSLGYFAVGILYTLLTVLLGIIWRGNRIAAALFSATLISAVWGFVFAAQTYMEGGFLSTLTLSILEMLRTGSWIIFLAMVCGQLGVSLQLRAFAVVSIPLVICVLVFATVSNFLPEIFGSIFVASGLFLSLVGLVLIEQLFRNSPEDTRWRIKPLVFGLGGLLTFDLFMYSQALLLAGIDLSTWIARGVVNGMFVPLIAIAARRNKDWELRVFVSRHVVFYSTTLVAAGVYMLAMSAGGYFIAQYGGTWGGPLQIIFFAGSGLVLAVLLFSSAIRARLRVFLNKHFFQNKYDYREEWMRLVDTLSEFGDWEIGSSQAISALAQVVKSPGGALWLKTEDGKMFEYTASVGSTPALADMPSNQALARFLEETHWLIDLIEFAAEPAKYKNLKLPEELQTRSANWLIIPICLNDDLMGMISLDRPTFPNKLNFEDRDLLKTVGKHVAVHLAQSRDGQLLAEAQQFEAYNRLTAFLMHDLNNLIAQQSLIVENAARHKRNPDFVDDAMQTIATSVERMKRVMRVLKKPDFVLTSAPTELRFLVSAAIDRCADREPVPQLQTRSTEYSISVDAERFTMVLAHLIRNAQDACEPTDSVRVEIDQEFDAAVISIVDTGSGMSPEFVRHRLFRPFDSTKGVQGMGIGAHQARDFIRKMGGELSVDSEIGRGTTFYVRLPVSVAQPKI